MEPIISVRNLGKRYRIRSANQKRYRSLREDLLEGLQSLFKGNWGKSQSEDFWALQNINFDVYQGEVVGIIGRNGAGKSTLLKILSRIVQPTTGEAIIRGRLGSLLEVGTGFHPELTGRENIFMNGAVLGMRQSEIKQKFDEIISFAEVEKFLDTPVKFYSSGMYVRLAFAVAAHLEPEILIVDEVLAVGDATFQKKCLGKMGDVSQKEGKTVLFVSHNMTALQSLCPKSIWLNYGKIQGEGKTAEIVSQYLQTSTSINNERIWNDPTEAPGNEYVRWHRVCIRPDCNGGIGEITVATPLIAKFECWNYLDNVQLNFSLHLFTIEGIRVLNTFSYPQVFSSGLIKGMCLIPAHFLNDQTYKITIMLIEDSARELHILEDALGFEVHDTERDVDWYGKWEGVVRPKLKWNLEIDPGSTRSC